MPENVAVPFVKAVNVIPDGRVPAVLAIAGVGTPLADTVNVPAEPIVKVALVALVNAGATPATTVRVKLWFAVPLLFWAVMPSELVLGAVGVPLIVAVPLPLSTKVTPEGSAPDTVSAGLGLPVVVTVKVLSAPTANVALVALVITGPVAATIDSVNVWFTVDTLLVAVNVSEVVPAVPVPLHVSVPDGEPGVKVTPAGRVPLVSVTVGAGIPVAVTGNVAGMVGVSMVKVVADALVNDGGPFTVSVKLCTASGAVPFVAVSVSG